MNYSPTSSKRKNRVTANTARYLLNTVMLFGLFLLIQSCLEEDAWYFSSDLLSKSNNPDEPTAPIGLEICSLQIDTSFEMVFETSFEEVEKKNANTLSMDLPHWFEFAAMHREDGGKGDGIGGARMWVDKNLANTGERSVGLRLHDIEQSRRAEFIIFPEDILTAEYHVSYWLYLPKNWGLYAPEIDWDWFEIGQPYVTTGGPYSAIYISHPDEAQSYFMVSLGGRDENGKKLPGLGTYLYLPKGRWFQVCYYVHRHKQNGEIKLWFDGQLIAEKSGFPTMHSSDSSFQISIAKIYHERNDTVPHFLWIDDLSLYTKKN